MHTYVIKLIVERLYLIIEGSKLINDATYNNMSSKWRACTLSNISADLKHESIV